MRAIALLLVAALGLVGCGAGGSSTKQYKISGSSTSKVQYQVLDSINALRAASGAPAVELNAQLNAAANQVAHLLLRDHPSPNGAVALYCSHDVPALIAMLGVLIRFGFDNGDTSLEAAILEKAVEVG